MPCATWSLLASTPANPPDAYRPATGAMLYDQAVAAAARAAMPGQGRGGGPKPRTTTTTEETL